MAVVDRRQHRTMTALRPVPAPLRERTVAPVTHRHPPTQATGPEAETGASMAFSVGIRRRWPEMRRSPMPPVCGRSRNPAPSSREWAPKVGFRSGRLRKFAPSMFLSRNCMPLLRPGGIVRRRSAAFSAAALTPPSRRSAAFSAAAPSPGAASCSRDTRPAPCRNRSGSQAASWTG